MKLNEVAKMLQNGKINEVDDEDRGKAPPISGGGTISTKQASEVLGVTVSRVRQLIQQGVLKPQIKPRDGDRDHELLKKDVDDLKSKGNSKDDSKDKDDKED
jgi:hypothetical protein